MVCLGRSQSTAFEAITLTITPPIYSTSDTRLLRVNNRSIIWFETFVQMDRKHSWICLCVVICELHIFLGDQIYNKSYCKIHSKIRNNNLIGLQLSVVKYTKVWEQVSNICSVHYDKLFSFSSIIRLFARTMLMLS